MSHYQADRPDNKVKIADLEANSASRDGRCRFEIRDCRLAFGNAVQIAHPPGTITPRKIGDELP
jgi:hypothetical protein